MESKQISFQTKLKQAIIPLAAAFTILCIMPGCTSEDEPETEHRIMPFHSAVGETYKEGKSVTVTSEAHPQSGQKHRSSPNFSTIQLGNHPESEPKYMVVSCPEGVTFKLNIDIPYHSDRVWDEDVYNGAIIPYIWESDFYISNPSGATGNFNVTFTAIFPCDDNIFVSSPGRHREGQNHRSSLNFVLPDRYARFLVHCSDPNVSFGIQEDVSGSDNPIA